MPATRDTPETTAQSATLDTTLSTVLASRAQSSVLTVLPARTPLYARPVRLVTADQLATPAFRGTTIRQLLISLVLSAHQPSPTAISV